MIRICAWCHQELLPAGGASGPVSHGMCHACATRFLRDCPVPLEQFLDDLPVPVLVVDSDVTAAYSNQEARKLAALPAEAIPGRKGGEVFNCVNAQTHEGCGHTIHCSGCVIRGSVLKTYASGQPQVLVPAVLKTGDPDHPASVALTITTMKRGESVVLMVNRAE